jgi:hypothetical protein
MKRILLTALCSFVLCLSFVACSDDDDSTPALSNNNKLGDITPTPSNSDKLVGKWVYAGLLPIEAEGANEITFPISYYEPCPSDIIEFKAGGVLVQTIYKRNYHEGTCESYTGDGKWSINGDVFTMENNDVEEGEGISKYTIIKLTYDTLKIEEPLPKHLEKEYKNIVKLQHTYKRL